jgi:hypothetical protein
MWCVARLDKEYIRRMEDVLDLYERPEQVREPLVCLDEKPVQLLEDARRLRRRVRCGRIRRRDYEYRRRGVVNIYCALAPKVGQHFCRVTPNRTAREFAKMTGAIARRYPQARKIHIVLDNLNTHCEKSLVDFYGQRKGRRIWRRFVVHRTPNHGSWLNQAEIEVCLVSRQVLGSGSRRIRDRRKLRDEIQAFNADANRRTLRINWRFTKTDARRTFGYNKRRIKRSKH